MPAQKKHASTRRRTNQAATATTLSAVDPDEVDIPELPPLVVYEEVDGPDGKPVRERLEVEWDPLTVQWWNDVWSSPMADEYLDADIHGLVRLAALVNAYWRDPCAKTHAEVRLAQKDYGLTPYDRRRLEWQIETTDDAKSKGNRRRRKESEEVQPPKPPGEEPGGDPRLTLVS
ncbi:hypothetical protein B5566_02500 [Mycobacterium sp. MHSD3]|nr:hypothetical protein B5566_02500 [Mycobacterium sp. MHSD3]